MNRFYDSIIKPVLELENIGTVVEIGAKTGENTAKLIGYVRGKGGRLYSIDPFPDFPCDEWEAENGGSFVMLKKKSLEALPEISGAQAYLIDGDHNWYTVHSELEAIAKSCGEDFPLVMLHDTCWPYERRDMYYDPEAIPEEYRRPYDKKPLLPGESGLCEEGLNASLNNAVSEGGEKNGVRTAVEDFIRENPSLGLSFYNIGILHGFGLIVNETRFPRAAEYFGSARALEKVIETAEADRIAKMIKLAETGRLSAKRKQRIVQLKDECEARKAKNEKLGADIESLKNRISEHKEKEGALREKLTGARESLSREREASAKQKERISALSEKLTSLRDKHKTLSERHEALKEKHEALREKHEALKEKYEALKEKNVRLTEKNSELRQQRDEFRAAAAADRQELRGCKSSYRYRAGTLVAESSHSLPGLLKLPFRLMKLRKEYKNAKNAKETT